MQPKKPSHIKRNILILIICIVIIGTIAASSSNPPSTSVTTSSNPIKSAAIEVTYDNLFRYNEQYVGKIIHFSGQVGQVMIESEPDNYSLLVATSEGVIWVDYIGPRVLEKDRVDVWGRVLGLRTYTSVGFVETTVPEVVSLILEVQGLQSTTILAPWILSVDRPPSELGQWREPWAYHLK